MVINAVFILNWSLAESFVSLWVLNLLYSGRKKKTVYVWLLRSIKSEYRSVGYVVLKRTGVFFAPNRIGLEKVKRRKTLSL